MSWLPKRDMLDPVQAIDTVGAGDTFNGALVVALSEGTGLVDAIRFACKAAAILVTRPGARTSVPYRREIKRTVT